MFTFLFPGSEESKSYYRFEGAACMLLHFIVQETFLTLRLIGSVDVACKKKVYCIWYLIRLLTTWAL